MHQIVLGVHGDRSTDLFCISPEIVLGSLDRFLRFLGALHAGDIELSGTPSHGCFKLEQPHHAVCAVGNSVNMTWFTGTFGNQLTAALLEDRYKHFFHIGKTNVGELHVVEFHTADFLQLLFDSSAALNGVLQNFLNLSLGKFSVRVQQFSEAGYHFADGDTAASSFGSTLLT